MMPDVADQPTDINTALFLLTSLSPSAKISLGLELQRVSAINEADEDYALGDALLNTIKDLNELGIECHFDYGDLINNPEELFRFTHLLQYLMPTSLYHLLKSNDRLKKTLGDILNGSLSYDQSVLQTYLSELGGLDGQEALYPNLTDITDYYTTILSQTPVFTDYLKHLLVLLAEQSLTKESLSKDHEEYNLLLKKLIARFQFAVDHFSNTESTSSFLNKALTLFISDMIKADHFHDYHYLWATNRQDLPEDLVDLFDQKWYHYRVSHPWCYDYYAIRNIPISEKETLLICIFAFVLHQTYEAFEDFVLKYQNSNLNSISLHFLNLYKSYDV